MAMMMQQQLQLQHIVGGATSSIFVKTEKYLFSKSRHQEGLALLGITDEYQSLMDAYFCLIFSEHKPACFRFYKGSGPQLRFVLSKERIRFYDEMLLMNLRAMKKLRDWEILSDLRMC